MRLIQDNFGEGGSNSRSDSSSEDDDGVEEGNFLEEGFDDEDIPRPPPDAFQQQQQQHEEEADATPLWLLEEPKREADEVSDGRRQREDVFVARMQEFATQTPPSDDSKNLDAIDSEFLSPQQNLEKRIEQSRRRKKMIYYGMACCCYMMIAAAVIVLLLYYGDKNKNERKVYTRAPSNMPTSAPTLVPTASPTMLPTKNPTNVPTAAPTAAPTSAPTTTPTSPRIDEGFFPPFPENFTQIENVTLSSTYDIIVPDTTNSSYLDDLVESMNRLAIRILESVNDDDSANWTFPEHNETTASTNTSETTTMMEPTLPAARRYLEDEQQRVELAMILIARLPTEITGVEKIDCPVDDIFLGLDSNRCEKITMTIELVTGTLFASNATDTLDEDTTTSTVSTSNLPPISVKEEGGLDPNGPASEIAQSGLVVEEPVTDPSLLVDEETGTTSDSAAGLDPNGPASEIAQSGLSGAEPVTATTSLLIDEDEAAFQEESQRMIEEFKDTLLAAIQVGILSGVLEDVNPLSAIVILGNSDTISPSMTP